MKKYQLLLVFLSSTFILSAQNLVRNPSFEMVGCNNYPLACYWEKPPNDMKTPDSYTLFGNQYSTALCNKLPGHNGWGGNVQNVFGNRFLGLLTYYIQAGQSNSREYVMTELNKPLEIDHIYKVGFHIKYAERCKFITDRMGLYLGNTPVGHASASFNNGVIPVNPQLDINYSLGDSTHWTKVEMFYTATGGERYLTIGNFTPDSLLQISLNPLYNANDTICLFPQYGAYYFLDSVFVIETSPNEVKDLETKSFSLSPNPATNSLQVNISQNLQILESYVYNILGERQSLYFDANYKMDVSKLLNGMYILKISSNKGILTRKFLISK